MPEPSESVAPNFSLQVANGDDVELADLWRDRHVLLWFSRGLACPFCRRQMVQVARVHDGLLAQGVLTVQVTPTELEIARRMLEYFPVPWPYASDPSGEVATAFGMEPEVKRAAVGSGMVEQGRAWGVLLRHPGEPHPEVLEPLKDAGPLPAREGGLVVVGRGGRILYRQPTGRLALLPSNQALVKTVRSVIPTAA